MEKGFSRLFARSRRELALGLCCVMAAGLFIWFKLRLVTGMPRSAYAEPERLEPKAKPEQKDPRDVKPETPVQKAPAKVH